MTTTFSGELTIGEVAETTGLSVDSLRWFEREGLFPAIRRNSGGQRRFTEDDLGRITLLLRLRRTGMPVKEIRRFVQLLEGREETHAERLQLFIAQRERILAEQRQLAEDLALVEHKIDYYTGKLDKAQCEAAYQLAEARARSR